MFTVRKFGLSLILRITLLICVTQVSGGPEPKKLSSRIITTKYGSLRGFVTTLPNRQWRPVEIYLGIPYARPPVGSLRFMFPVTPANWRGVKSVEHFSAVCPQRLPEVKNETEALKVMPIGRYEYLKRLVPLLKNQSEDCLYLNIYAPALAGRDPTKLPVLVFIHGESYEWNAGNPYDGSILSSLGNVVVVTMNYRLGILGFLPATSGSVRGNYGLMDQVAALHWVQGNIGEFGGDKKNVTIIGQGHGAAFVNLLMISPMSKGLFQRAIMQSGSALSPWALAHDALTYGRQVCGTLNCPVTESEPMLDCMRQRPLADIMKVQIMVPEHLSAFGPTVDGIVVPVDPLIPMQEKESLFAQYDLMFGVTRAEHFYHLSANEEKLGIDADKRDRILRTLVRNLFNYHMQEIFLTIVNEYTDWTRPVQHPVSILDATLEALGDGLTVAPLIRTGSYHSKTRSKTYMYVFGYQTENGDYPQRHGAIHGEDLAYLFGAPMVATLSHFPRNYTKGGTSLSEAVMSYWINFARSGDPNITPRQELESLASDRSRGRFEKFAWSEYETVHQKYLLIGMKPRVRDHYRAHRLSFWLNLIPQLHRPGSTSIVPQHHLLDDHNNPLTYDGVVRPVADGQNDSASMGPFRGGLQSISTTIPTTTDIPFNLTTLGTSTSTEDPLKAQVKPDDTVNASAATNGTARSLLFPDSTYSTALSVTIAVGVSLLILNILIFAGVYYQRDKNRMEMLQKRKYKVYTIETDL